MVSIAPSRHSIAPSVRSSTSVPRLDFNGPFHSVNVDVRPYRTINDPEDAPRDEKIQRFSEAVPSGPSMDRATAAMHIQRVWLGWKGRKALQALRRRARAAKDKAASERRNRLAALRQAYEAECASVERARRIRQSRKRGEADPRASPEIEFADDAFGRQMSAILKFKSRSRESRGNRAVEVLQRRFLSRRRERAEQEAAALRASASREMDRTVRRVQALWRGRLTRVRTQRLRKSAWRAKLRVPDRERLSRLFRFLDRSNRGALSATDWLRASMKGFDPSDVENPWSWYTGNDDDDDSTPSKRASATRGRGRGGARLSLSADQHMRVFRTIDADENGEVDEEEFIAFFLRTKDGAMLDWMQSLLIAILEPEEWATKADKERKMDMLQALRLRKRFDHLKQGLFARRARQFFRTADDDNSKHITPLEFLRALALGNARATLTSSREAGVAVFQELDTDGSGGLEEDEFIQAVQSTNGGPKLFQEWCDLTYGSVDDEARRKLDEEQD